MKSSNTLRLFLGAAALFAFIYFFDREGKRQTASAPRTILGRIVPREITAVGYSMSNLVMRAERTDDTWRLTKPSYPAQVTPIEVFLEQIVALPKLDVISPSEVAGKLKEFGLEPPMGVISLNVGSNRYQLQIGGREPIANQLYVQSAGSAEVIITDAAFLKSLPTNVNAWRSPMLANMSVNGRSLDRLQIGGQRLLEFERDETNELWRISKPTAARADNARLDQLLRRFFATQVKEFVTDLPVVDLERYGLQPPALVFSFYADTNRIASFEFGGSPTNDPSVVYVRRMMHTNIVTVPREIFDDLNQPYKAFHDPHLITIDPNQLSQIRVNGTNGFTIAKITNGVWQITEPTPMLADAELMQVFLKQISGLEIVDFAKDVPSDADLTQFGFVPPSLTIALFGAQTNLTGAVTNALISELSFGANRTNDTIYARRGDEIPIYVTPYADVWLLPNLAWKLRDRRIFEFAPANVIVLGVITAVSTNVGGRDAGGWTTDQIQNAAIEEGLFRLGNLQTRRWLGKGGRDLGSLGITNGSPQLQLAISRDGATNSATIWFGKRGIRNNIYAATVLPGENEVTAFEFPGDTYDLLARARLAPAQ